MRPRYRQHESGEVVQVESHQRRHGGRSKEAWGTKLLGIPYGIGLTPVGLDTSEALLSRLAIQKETIKDLT
jgi:hypothetical protein